MRSMTSAVVVASVALMTRAEQQRQYKRSGRATRGVTVVSSKGLSNREMQRRPRFELPSELAAIELEPEIEPDRTDRRSITQPEAHGAEEVRDVEVAAASEHVAGVDEEGGADVPPHRRAKLCVQDHRRVAADRESLGLIVSGVPTVSSAYPRIVVSPPAKNRSLAGSCFTVTVIGFP